MREDAELRRDFVTRREFDKMSDCIREGRATIDTRLSRMEAALFHGDPENRTPGLVPLARRISIWLDGLCKLWRLAAWFVTGLLSLLLMLKSLGLF